MTNSAATSGINSSSPLQIAVGDLMEALPNGLFLKLDDRLHVISARGRGLAAIAPDPGSMCGNPLQASLAPALVRGIVPRLRAALAGETITFELPAPGNGRLQVSAAPAGTAEDGRWCEVQLFGLWIGIAEENQPATRVNREQLELAVRAGNIALWDWDLNTNKVHYSTEWKRQLGCEEHEIGDEFYEWEQRIHPDDLPGELARMQQYLAAPASDYRSELRLRHKDGTYRHILTYAALDFDSAGQPVHIYGSDIDITTRVQAEEALRASAAALRRSEDKFVQFFQLSPVAMNVSQLDTGAILDANDAFVDLLGYSRTEMLGQSPLALGMFTPAALGPMFDAFLRNGRVRDAELAVTCKSGVVKECLVAAELMNLLDGQFVLISLVDISVRKRNEVRLRASETALNRSQEVAHIGHWTWDTPSHTLTWSDEMKRIFGLDPRTFDGDLKQVFEHAIHPGDAERVRALNAAVRDQQQVPEAEYRVVWPDGSVHHVRAIPADSVRDEQGGIIQLSGVVQDITERKLRDLERELLLVQLQDKADQLAQVMRSVPEGVLLLDNRGSIALANPQAEKLLALLAEYGTEQDKAYDDDRILLKLGGTVVEALLTSPPEGQWHTIRAGRQIFELLARPLEGGPVPAGWVMVLREVTAERAVQEQLQRQERLAAVGQLAAGIAHDFNNIMSVISIYAEMTSEAPGLSPKERTRTLTIIEQAQRATRMIRQILDFSRRSVFERQVLDLLPLLKEEEKLLRQTLPESIEMECRCTPGEYLVLGDPTRLQQLIMNLAVNARDAMPEGGCLLLGLRKLSIPSGKNTPVPGMGEGEWLCFEMQDTGAGIPPEHLAHIFEPFFTTKAPGKGTGLGLAQAHGIVAQHDGYISVASESGAGTTFSIFLPAVSLAPLSSARGGQVDLPRGSGERILVVEDEATLRASLVELLTNLGYGVAEATNGEEALARLRKSSLTAGGAGEAPEDELPGLLISDVVMPRLGGVGLLKALRHEGVEIPAILMSGHPIGEERAGLETLGMYAWLDKPPSRQQLAQAVAGALAARR
ncbi:MAG: PAS domain S-box protein [Caldilineaceae bacterium]